MALINSIAESSICTLARSYNILDPFNELKNKVAYTYQSDNICQYSKKELHWLINELLLEFYKGESTLKAKLVDLFIKKNVTAAFEIKVNRSRVDFISINGISKSFEIKSELDNLYKLSKQVNDYEKVFDENYIVIDQKHYVKSLSLIPVHYGIMVLDRDKIIESRPASINKNLDPYMQLKLFSKKEISQHFKIEEITTEEILINFDASEINQIFKEMLKKRYEKKWNFIVENQDGIFSSDYQFFFQHNIAPEIIYK